MNLKINRLLFDKIIYLSFFLAHFFVLIYNRLFNNIIAEQQRNIIFYINIFIFGIFITVLVPIVEELIFRSWTNLKITYFNLATFCVFVLYTLIPNLLKPLDNVHIFYKIYDGIGLQKFILNTTKNNLNIEFFFRNYIYYFIPLIMIICLIQILKFFKFGLGKNINTQDNKILVIGLPLISIISFLLWHFSWGSLFFSDIYTNFFEYTISILAILIYAAVLQYSYFRNGLKWSILVHIYINFTGFIFPIITNNSPAFLKIVLFVPWLIYIFFIFIKYRELLLLDSGK